jgi:IS5 family transposase
VASSVRDQRRGQRGKKIYSLHAPEVECIGKGKPHKPYEFGVKVSVATTLNHSAGGQFVAHVKGLPGNPYEGHTLATIIPDIRRQIGGAINRIVADQDIAATTRLKNINIKSTSAGRSGASPKPSNATSGGDQPSNR